MQIIRYSFLVCIFYVLAACSILPEPYHIEIPQGNLINDEKLAQVQVGMEPRQVRFLLGSPLLTDTFNQHRWDYYYSTRQQSRYEVKHHVSVYFDQGRVSVIDKRPIID